MTAVLTVMMYYIMDALSVSKDITDGSLKLCLTYAVAVIIIFAVIFLFYTNSFLIKRRKKEIGVYNILGMGKRHIAKMLAVENLITAFVSIAAGLLGGIVFSKLMYLALLKILHNDVSMNFAVSPQSMIRTVVLFAAIFTLTLIYNLLQIKIANPVELLQGGHQGEREPKTKWLLAIVGFIFMGIGYAIAITVESPLSALGMFFVAVVCVILGTYALFTAGSIALLKALRKNKTYYYKTKHFTSVSGMIYRMKQNAAGLANICILSTMVLVMVSTSVSLYIGMEDVLTTRYPREVEVTLYHTSDDRVEALNRIIEEEAQKEELDVVNEIGRKEVSLNALRKDGSQEFSLLELSSYAAGDLLGLIAIPVEEYNRISGTDTVLAPDEVLLFTDVKEMYGEDTMKIGSQTFHVKEELTKFPLVKKCEGQIYPTYYLVVSGEEHMQKFMEEAYAESTMEIEWREQFATMRYKTAFDLEGDEEACLRAVANMQTRMGAEVGMISCESREMSRSSFYTLYGGLLFIGIYLGAMFLMATVLIIYYKQISEGYDDKERYQIMQKVGMSKKEVRSSIRSQVLSVFFLPLIVAVIHIAVAFKVITKLLALLNLMNVSLFFVCTVITIAVFAVFYAVVYALTAREYYRIVN